MLLFTISAVVIVLVSIIGVWKSVKRISNTEVHVGIHEVLAKEKEQEEIAKARTTVVMEVQPAFKEELKKAQEKQGNQNAHELELEREAKRKAERLKIEQAKRQRQAELTRRQRQTHDSGITNPTSYEMPYVASEPSYSSGSSCSSSSSYDSGNSSSSSDSSGSSYSSCD